MSIGGRGSEDWLRGLIVDARQIVENEVWTIAVQFTGNGQTTSTTSFYVVEPTCEVIGTVLSSASHPAAETYSSLPSLRIDWSTYIQSHLCGAPTFDDNLSSLFQHLKWANYAEYDRGISRLWLKRIKQEGEAGLAKRAVAERYILASVVANRRVISPFIDL